MSETPPPTSPPEIRTKLIVVIDDTPLVRDMISDVLQDAGFPVMTFGDAADALERIPRDVGLVLLDLVMPQAALDGFGFLSGARARPELANTPVIVLSGLGASVAEVMDPATASALRITAVITKPVEMPVLLSAVRDALGAADRP